MMETTTWANGFGTWHAKVPNARANPRSVARNAIRQELQDRSAPGEMFRGLRVQLVEKTETHSVYRENWQD
jgi:hypothetical protein